MLLTQSTTMGLSDIAESEYECEDTKKCNHPKGSPRWSVNSLLLDLEPIDMSKP